MLSTIFFRVMEMSITVIPVIVVVMIIRLLLKRLPKSFSYVLWALVAFRLIVPVSISSEISIFNLSARISNLNNRIEAVNTKKNLEKYHFGLMKKNDNIFCFMNKFILEEKIIS